ncbi:hypothetical protein Fmac_001749 [Flemingia macrophylla]|uniref:Uncharacterized protein n=1 Tax=Flemingia macrophylla TaxID=520843 RepID=A0ABD1NI04_9FABA
MVLGQLQWPHHRGQFDTFSLRHFRRNLLLLLTLGSSCEGIFSLKSMTDQDEVTPIYSMNFEAHYRRSSLATIVEQKLHFATAESQTKWVINSEELCKKCKKKNKGLEWWQREDDGVEQK